jgi:hypothetical protein
MSCAQSSRQEARRGPLKEDGMKTLGRAKPGGEEKPDLEKAGMCGREMGEVLPVRRRPRSPAPATGAQGVGVDSRD